MADYITGLDANLIRRETGRTISPNENWLQDAAPLFNIILLYKQIRFCAVENLPGQPVLCALETNTQGLLYNGIVLC